MTDQSTPAVLGFSDGLGASRHVSDDAFERWYSAQSHQLTNEGLCRLIWRRGWDAAMTPRTGYDLHAMCEAFHRLIEAYVCHSSPFHHPVSDDAQVALRILRGIANAMPTEAPNVSSPDRASSEP